MENAQQHSKQNKHADLSWMQRRTRNSIQKIVLQSVTKHSFDEPRELLDLSAGTGEFLEATRQHFPKTRLTGIEPDEANVKLAVKRVKGALLYVAHSTDLPLYNESVDVAVSIGVYDRWRHPVKSVREAMRVLRPSGLLVLADRYDAKELHQTLKAEGFQVLHQTRHWPSLMRITVAKKRG